MGSFGCGGIGIYVFILLHVLNVRLVLCATCTGQKFFSGAYSFYFLSTFYCPHGCCGLYKEEFCCVSYSYYTTKIPIIRTLFPTLPTINYNYYYYYYYYTYDSLNIGAVVGGIVGGLLFLILFSIGMALLCTHLGRRSTRRAAIISQPTYIQRTAPPNTVEHQIRPQTPVSNIPSAHTHPGQPTPYTNQNLAYVA